MKRRLWAMVGVALVMVGMGLIMPAVAQVLDTGALKAVGVCLLQLGIILTAAGAWAMLRGSGVLGWLRSA